jgi:tyrosine-protein phosphatase
MTPVCGPQSANDRVLKRSFHAVTLSSSTDRSSISGTVGLQERKTRQRQDGIAAQGSGYRSSSRKSSKMPSAAGPRMYENHIPSFMSVYDMDASPRDNTTSSAPTNVPATSYQIQQQPQQRPESSTLHQNLNQSSTQTRNEISNSQPHGHQHCGSTSTQTSDSTDSSPTTTISTIDSVSLSDPSPSSSPESPITLVPLSSFTGGSFGLDAFQSLKMADLNPVRPPLSDERPMTSPSPRKFKNPKSLALNLGGLSTAAEPSQASEPSSPSFIKPPPLKPRKKPSLLSLNTGTANASLGDALASPRLAPMPSMLQRRGLKHSVSSPQMLTTPGFGPSGGMTLGTGERKGFGPLRFKESSLQTNAFAISEEADHEAPAPTQMATRIPGVMVGGDSFDRPHSGEDAKSPSYPNGPILMWEPSVHLYMEPKLEEAREFDVVINVAREVKNPFKVAEEQVKVPSNNTILTHNPKPSYSSDIPPDTAASMLSFRTAFEVQPPSSTDSSPTTPKPMTEPRQPEYIHMPWDHNTDVKDELWDLCQTIDARVKEGKRILIHCQQGASRSATLVIAYGMYIHPELGATEAYQKAQERSKWVNPNMSLLFSLNDFKKIVDSKKNEKVPTSRKTTISRHRPTLSTGTIDLPSTPSRARGNSTPGATAREGAVTAAKEKDIPASESAISRFSDFDFGFNTQPPIQPQFRHEAPAEDDWEALMSPRVTEMTQNPFNISPKPKAEPFATGFGGGSVEAESEPALFSPRAFEFPRSSFFPTSSLQRMPPAVVKDPRSPPTTGEAPIIRSIDDFL